MSQVQRNSVMEPTWQTADGRVRLYLADCMDVLPTLEGVDAVVTDPPYGLGDKWQGGTWFTRGVYQGDVSWDEAAPHEAVEQLLSRGLPTVLWGGNYFRVPPSRCWLSWHKTNAVPTMADWEAAWTNMDKPSKAFSRPCNGWDRKHPTEKPLDLMVWSVGFVSGDTVLDPFMGSGTTGVACICLGRRFIGIEKEPKYFEIAKRRIQEALGMEVKGPSGLTQRRMFSEAP